MMSHTITELVKETAKKQEEIILDQLNDFVSRGLIILETTVPVLVHDEFSDKVIIRQSCKLVLKDKEYIESLEKENGRLALIIENLKSALNSP